MRPRYAPAPEPPDLPEPPPETPPCACSACLDLSAALDQLLLARRDVARLAANPQTSADLADDQLLLARRDVARAAALVDKRHHLDRLRHDDGDVGDDWRHVRVGPHVIALEPLRAALTDRGHPHGATPTRLRTAPPF